MRHLITAAFAIVSSFGFSTAAYAQDLSPFLQSDIPFDYSRGRNTGVLERYRPEYSSEGIPAGGFTISPRMSLSGIYDDNVYATKANKVDDVALRAAPSVRVDSNWSVHALSLQAGGNFLRYADETLKDEDGWYFGTSGKLALGTETSLSGAVRTTHTYESRVSPSTVADAVSSIPYQRTEMRAMLEHRINRTRLVGSTDFTDIDFDPIVSASGVRRDQTSRNRQVWRVTGQAEYAISPDAAVFGQAQYVDTSYMIPLPGLQYNRDSTGYRLLGGVSFDLTALARGKLGAGYTERSYKNAVYTDIKAFSVEAQVDYFPTELTTVSVGFTRDIQDSAVAGSSGYLRTAVDGRVDHEFLRNLLGNVRASYETVKYKGIDGKSDIVSVSAGARYLFNRNLTLAADLTHFDRSNQRVVLPEFDNTTARLTLTYSL